MVNIIQLPQNLNVHVKNMKEQAIKRLDFQNM